MIYNYTNDELYKTGIYIIININNGKFYIGSASSTSRKITGFKMRLNDHIRKLNVNNHRNPHLQNSWNKYGSNNFIFIILEFVEPEKCKEIEQKWLNYTDATIYGYNICKTSLTNPYPRSNKTREKISHALSGRTRPFSVHNSIRKKVLQYDKSGNFIKEYPGISIAARETQTHRQDIGKVCLGKLKSANGFIWKYKNDDSGR